MSSINVIIKLRCLESMVGAFEQLILIPGIKEIIESSNHGRGLMRNIEMCKIEIKKLEAQ